MPPPLPLAALHSNPLFSSARMWGTTRSSRSTVSYSRIRETTTDPARPSNTTMCVRPSPPTTTRGALLSVTTAKCPKAAPKVRKCGPRRCVRGCVVPGVDQMGLWVRYAGGREHVHWGESMHRVRLDAAGRARVP